MGKGNMQRIKILSFSIAAALIGLFDVYLMINIPENYLVLGIASLVFLAVLSFAVNGILKSSDKDARNAEERDKSVMVSERACYLLLRKKSNEIVQKLRKIEEQRLVPLEKSTSMTKHEIAKMLDSVMEDQKKIAQVTVSRSKENANAMMNSNDRLLERMDDFTTILGEMEQELLEKQEELIREKFQAIEEYQEKLGSTVQSMENKMSQQLQDAVASILNGQKETLSHEKTERPHFEINHQGITEQVEQLESSMKQEISRILQRVNELSESMKRFENDKERLSFSEKKEMSEEAADTAQERKSVVELDDGLEPGAEPMTESEEVFEEEPKSIVELPQEEELSFEEEPKSIVELQEEAELALALEEEPKSIVELPEEEELFFEEEPKSIVEMMAEAETIPAEEPKSIVELAAELGIEPESEKKSIAEMAAELESEPDMKPIEQITAELESMQEKKETFVPDDNPNKIMSPDEIAALLSSTSQNEEPEAVETIEEPREEKKEPVPIVSENPNKVMTPEEIAALIASM